MDFIPGRGDGTTDTSDGSKPTGGTDSNSKPTGKLVAFTAKLNIEDSYPADEGVLRFARVLANEGQGYDPDTGIFTCPSPGFYHFSVHLSTYGRAQCAIVKNGQSVVSLYHTTLGLKEKCSQMASISSVIQLSENDRVWVNLPAPEPCSRNDIFATADNDSVFVGFALG